MLRATSTGVTLLTRLDDPDLSSELVLPEHVVRETRVGVTTASKDAAGSGGGGSAAASTDARGLVLSLQPSPPPDRLESD